MAAAVAPRAWLLSAGPAARVLDVVAYLEAIVFVCFAWWWEGDEGGDSSWSGGVVGGYVVWADGAGRVGEEGGAVVGWGRTEVEGAWVDGQGWCGGEGREGPGSVGFGGLKVGHIETAAQLLDWKLEKWEKVEVVPWLRGMESSSAQLM